MSRLLSLHLIAKNVPLHTWEQYEKDNDLEKTSQQSTGYSNKNNTRVISDIVRQLSSDKTVALIARDKYIPNGTPQMHERFPNHTNTHGYLRAAEVSD